MKDLDQIREALKLMRLDIVSQGSDVHRNVIASIRDGRTDNPSYQTVRKLSDFLDRTPAPDGDPE
jgi:predicted transcriptional regulator